MKRLFLYALLCTTSGVCEAQENDTHRLSSFAPRPASARKGSYRYYGSHPSIEDNSMFLEEAFNQDTGVIQHIFSTVYNDGDVIYSYTQELPLRNTRHQLSFGLTYADLKEPDHMTTIAQTTYVTSGLGDFSVHYRSMVFDENDWAMVTPRVSLIIPTGNARYNLGEGAWGGQLAVAVTKRLSRRVVTHYNAGYTYYSGSDYYRYDKDLNPTLVYEKDLEITTVGASAIWLVSPGFNMMLECLSGFQEEILDNSDVICQHNLTINPGVRMAFDIGKVQVVPGLGIPFTFEGGQYSSTGAFVYLSIEPTYTSED